MPGLCRDCLADAGDGHRCPACGSPRLAQHRELNSLAIAHVDCDAFYAAIEKRDDPSLGDKPLIVLIAGDKARPVTEQFQRATDPNRKVFEEKRYQKIAQAQLSRNGKYVVVESDHHIHLYQPAWVVEAIRQVVEAARKNAR